MGTLLKFTENNESLKLVIMDYNHKIVDIIHYTNKYYTDHWHVFKRNKEKEKILDRQFNERLNNFIYIEKISELLVILYLEDLKGNQPSIYELNRLLRRTSLQYSATFKQIDKLKKLNIVYVEAVKDSSRKEKKIYINKDVVTLYGDDEFRQMMLDSWNADAKEYIKKKLNWLKEEKEKFEKDLNSIKKHKRIKKGRGERENESG